MCLRVPCPTSTIFGAVSCRYPYYKLQAEKTTKKPRRSTQWALKGRLNHSFKSFHCKQKTRNGIGKNSIFKMFTYIFERTGSQKLNVLLKNVLYKKIWFNTAKKHHISFLFRDWFPKFANMLHSMLRQDLKKDKKIRKTNIFNLRNNVFKNVDFLICFCFSSEPASACCVPTICSNFGNQPPFIFF